MLYLRSLVNVADNSGAKIAMVIKILGKKAGSPGHIGDRCVVVCKEVRKNIATGKQKVGKSDIRHAIITRTRKGASCFDGRHIKFGENAVVLIDKKGFHFKEHP
ncbi:large ribosomal subunit protein uL14-like isoform X2 [Zophobas morio]|uniref:large ribosomal subunit protein uL14-like isoform X2 n=1 Tax=Zophobas morio TaxID=2755281 RepID=UPI003083736E